MTTCVVSSVTAEVLAEEDDRQIDLAGGGIQDRQPQLGGAHADQHDCAAGPSGADRRAYGRLGARAVDGHVDRAVSAVAGQAGKVRVVGIEDGGSAQAGGESETFGADVGDQHLGGARRAGRQQGGQPDLRAAPATRRRPG